MTMDLKRGAVCAAMLTLASAGLGAREGGPSRPFFARMVLQGVTFQVESPNDSSINPVTVRAISRGQDTYSVMCQDPQFDIA